MSTEIHKDPLGRTFKLSRTPQRIVSLVPSQTELLYDLGLEENIVGVTKFCVHPKHLRKSSTVVGGTKDVHYERIKALNPDIILCNKEENTPEIVAHLEKIAPVHVSDVRTLEHALKLIVQYGRIFKKVDSAEDWVAKIKEARKSFEDFIREGQRLKTAYLIWKDPLMAVGGDTFIDEMLSMNGFENRFRESASRYPEIGHKDLSNLDLLLLSSEPFPFAEKHKKEIQKHTDAKILFVDGEYFSWYGSRLAKAFEYFRQLQSSSAP